MKDKEEEKYSLRRNGGVIFVQTHFRTRVYWKNSRNDCMTGVHVLRRTSLPIAIHANSCEEKVWCTAGVHEKLNDNTHFVLFFKFPGQGGYSGSGILKLSEDDSLNKVPFLHSSRYVYVFWYVSHSHLEKESRSFSLLIGYSHVPGRFSKEMYSQVDEVGRRPRALNKCRPTGRSTTQWT